MASDGWIWFIVGLALAAFVAMVIPTTANRIK
jgi:hypothetical protein